MDTGKKLENEFVISLNNKYFEELNLNMQKFISFAFKDFNQSHKINCRKLSNWQKADISIQIGEQVKYISIKTGSQNSVHVEKLNDFITFLCDNNVENKIINNLLIYHYGDNTLMGDGTVRYSAEECKLKYKKEILEFNRYINNSSLMQKIIKRFLLTGTKATNKCVDIIYYGNIDMGIWCTSEELLKFCINHKSMYMNTPHFSIFTYQNWCRNVTFKSKSESHRNYLQIKWFSILSDLGKIRNINDD